MASKTKPKEQPPHAFKGGVHVSASFERAASPMPDDDRTAYLKRLYIAETDLDGEDTSTDAVWADASCGQDCFVCRIEEIPALIGFLQKIHDSKSRA